MRSVELVIHCFAEKRPDFAKLLTAQLSSLWVWPPERRIYVTICTSIHDAATISVASSFVRRCYVAGGVGVSIKLMALEPCMLFRRAIGRNLAFKASDADIVFATDADYIFADGCLEKLATSDFKGLAFPRSAWIHRSHQVGDQELARIKPGELFRPDLTLFQPWGVKFAIGGLQIVDGDTARSRGYLDGTRWVKPVPTATDFINTREDRVFRGMFPKSTPLDLPNLYRARHSASAFQSAESRLRQTAK